MDENRISQDFAVKLDALERISERTTLLPPWLFRHDDLLKSLESARILEQKNLINTINYIHFTDSFVFVLLQHPVYNEGILLKALPEPCIGKEVALHWQEGDLSGLKLANFKFQYLIIADGQSIILIPAGLQYIDGNGMRIELDNEGYAVGQRKARRYICHGVTAELNQSGFIAKGTLYDFNPLGFRIKINTGSSSFFSWFNPDQQITIHLYQEEKPVFSGPCRIIRQSNDLKDREVVLAPVNDAINRFRKKLVRNTRRQLASSPTITFEHPFFKKKVTREVNDISNLGFSVFEASQDAVLLPGMIIPEITINFHSLSHFQIRCLGQVVYRQKGHEKGVLCGIAILDMDIKTYSLLTHIISNLLDPHARLSQEVDMDELWKFFFETGFIYPEKYKHIHRHRRDFKKVYEKLYLDAPDIARHFTYEKDGRVYAHISMIKAYTRAWVVHHHSAKTMESKITGLRVLKQIVQYLNGFARLPSAKTDYALCYYRPDNEFPDHVFGDFARELENLQGSSLDLFSYTTFTAGINPTFLPDGWKLTEFTAFNLWELERFYKHHSGGLLLDALGLKNGNMVDADLEKQHLQLGFIRKCEKYSLTFQGDMTAVLIVEQSAPGLNLSELINGIKVLVIKPDMLKWDILSHAISQLTGVFNNREIPLLIYPAAYTQSQHIIQEKQYQLWILNLRDNDSDYCEYVARKFRLRLA